MPLTIRQIIEERRRNHEARRIAGFQPETENSLNASESAIFRHGRVVWGSILKANQALYSPGKIDARGCIVFSFDPYFDEHLNDLTAVQSAVVTLRGKTPEDPALKAFAAVVSDDYSTTSRQVIPAVLAKGRDVRYEELFVRRGRLPTSYLVDRAMPVIADPHQSSGVMLLPLRLWAETLARHWNSLAAQNTPIPQAPQAAMSWQQFSANALSITRAAAQEMNKIIAQQKLKQPVLRVAEERGLYSMDLNETTPDPNQDFSYVSAGIRVTIDSRCAQALMGIEIDFVVSPKGRGFKFNKRGL